MDAFSEDRQRSSDQAESDSSVNGAKDGATPLSPTPQAPSESLRLTAYIKSMAGDPWS